MSIEIPDQALDAALLQASKDGELPFSASVKDFTDEEVAHGELARADEIAEEANRRWMRAALTACLAEWGFEEERQMTYLGLMRGNGHEHRIVSPWRPSVPASREETG